MDQGGDANIHASVNRQSASQSSHLCHACRSVLTRQSFQKARCYRHHRSLKAFMQASRMKCYICSWMLSVLPESDQETLRALSEKRILNNMVAIENDVSTSDTSTTSWQALQMEQSGRTWDWRDSFTGMEMQCLPSSSSVGEVRVLIYLNPSYQGYFPLSTRVYDSWLRDFWSAMDWRMSFVWSRGLVLIADEGTSIHTRTFKGRL